MENNDWINGFPSSVIVCAKDGTILEMNPVAARAYEKDGGLALIGSNLLDCHPEPARSLLTEMLESGRKNVYTIEKKGVRKLIYQAPWYLDGEYAGFVELSLELPAELPHFIRS